MEGNDILIFERIVGYLHHFRELLYPNSTVSYQGETDINVTPIIADSLPLPRKRSPSCGGGKEDPFQFNWIFELFKDNEGNHDTEAQSLFRNSDGNPKNTV